LAAGIPPGWVERGGPTLRTANESFVISQWIDLTKLRIWSGREYAFSRHFFHLEVKGDYQRAVRTRDWSVDLIVFLSRYSPKSLSHSEAKLPFCDLRQFGIEDSFN